MATGYEVGMYRNIAQIARALERIADVLETEDQYGAAKRESDSAPPRSLGSSNTPGTASGDAPEPLSA